jgi:hypothetical protein
MEHFACTPNPDGGWIPQQARKLIMRLGDEQPFRFLTHGRDKVQPRLSGLTAASRNSPPVAR